MNPISTLNSLLYDREKAVEAEFKRRIVEVEDLDEAFKYLRRNLDEINNARRFLMEHTK